MGRKAMGSKIIRFTTSQRQLILDYLEGRHIHDDTACNTDWKTIVGKLNAQNNVVDAQHDETVDPPCRIVEVMTVRIETHGAAPMCVTMFKL